jgi:hypothetical protein
MSGGSLLLLKSIIEVASFLDTEHYAANKDIEYESEQSTTTTCLETCSRSSKRMALLYVLIGTGSEPLCLCPTASSPVRLFVIERWFLYPEHFLDVSSAVSCGQDTITRRGLMT